MTESEVKQHLDAAEQNPKQVAAAVLGLPEKILRFKPAPDKWCILEMLGHLADVEIVYSLPPSSNARRQKACNRADGPG